jgi:uncharacterized protein YegL
MAALTSYLALALLLGAALTTATPCSSSSCTCSSSYGASSKNTCQADLIIAIDTANDTMGNVSNVNGVLEWVGNNLITQKYIAISSQAVAFQIFYEKTSRITTFSTGYTSACNEVDWEFLSSSAKLPYANRSSLYSHVTTYLYNARQYGRPGYPATLVYFTGDHSDSVLNSASVVQKLNAAGVNLIVVGLNQTKESEAYWKQLTPLYNGSSAAQMDQSDKWLAEWIVNNTCGREVGLVSSAPYERANATNGAQLANAVGNPCSTDLSQAWMDIVLVFDQAISSDDLDYLGYALIELISTLNLDSKAAHASCVGVVAYSATATTSLNALGECAGFDSLWDSLNSLGQIAISDQSTSSDMVTVMNETLNAFRAQTTKRPQLMILAANSVNTTNSAKLLDIAQQLRDEGVFIATILGNSSITAPPTNATLISMGVLAQLSSSQVVFNITTDEDTFVDQMEDQFVFGNCRCPNNTLQFHWMNATAGETFFYADCLYSPPSLTYTLLDDVNPTAWPQTSYFVAERICEENGGTLLTMTSQQKVDFFVNEVLKKTAETPPASNFHVGFHRQVYNNVTEWYYYGDQAFPLGSNISPGEPNYADHSLVCGRLVKTVVPRSTNSSTASDYVLRYGNCDAVLPFMCQIQAWDAEKYTDDYKKFI